MPVDFADIHLGMKVAEVLSAREGVKPMVPFPSEAVQDNETNGVYIEYIDEHKYFDFIVYVFEKNTLIAVSFVGRLKKNDFKVVEVFLGDQLSRWGAPDKYAVAELRGDSKTYDAPVIAWWRSGILVSLVYTPIEHFGSGGTVQLKIIKGEEIDNALSRCFVIQKLTDVELNKISDHARKFTNDYMNSVGAEENGTSLRGF